MKWMRLVVQDDLHLDVAVLADQSVPSAYCPSIPDSTGNHRLMEHSEQGLANVEGPQPPQKVEATLALPIERIGVLDPVQFLINVESQMFIFLHHVHSDRLDGNRGHWHPSPPPQIHHQFLSLCHIGQQVVQPTPCDKYVQYLLVLFLAK
ncbi:hypothetical protein CHARACLAT_015520 [Characodon lateralis]|uniref:Uncharacterized protein n=1 Tax=Characodon lateralis TaxID=208331 RepID=A0ABU7E9Z5_9TELE|nr:hypothetical protein [Characodon lateralis]